MAAKAKTEWSLVCITRKGKVSILKDLDLYTAREAYKKLCPSERPKKYIWPDCGMNGSWSGGAYYCSSDDDRLDNVEVIGPTGIDLDPWHGVEREVIDLRTRHELMVAAGHEHCSKCSKLTEEMKEQRRRRELFAAVPTAFWLDDSPASVTGTGTAKTAQPVEGRSPARTARRATPNPLSHAEAKQPALSTGQPISKGAGAVKAARSDQ